MPWVKGQSGNPGGRKPLPAEVREAIRTNGEKAVARMNQLLNDDEAWGRFGWMDQKVQIRLLEVAQARAYGHKPMAEIDQPAQVVDAGSIIRQVYDGMKAEGTLPEFRNSRKASETD